MLEKKENKTKRTELEKSEPAPVVRTPFAFMRRFAEDMDRMFEDFEDFRFPRVFGKEFFPFRMELKDVEWMPQLEVVQDNEHFKVRCDLPGMKKDDIKVEMKDEVLTISGERHEEKKEEGEGFYRTERSYGSFYRQVPLPPGVKSDTAEATFLDGVLEIKMLATKKEPSARKLEIKETAAKAVAKAAG
jgi:HSP20 family protein